jgi:hypothetical protein
VATGIQNRLPALYRLFAAYVNQDWDDHGRSPDAAVKVFIKESKPEDVARARTELDGLLATKLDDGRLDKTLTSLRCGYDWSKAGGATAWLQRVRKLLG